MLWLRGVDQEVDGRVKSGDFTLDGEDSFNTIHEVKGSEPIYSFGGHPIDPQG